MPTLDWNSLFGGAAATPPSPYLGKAYNSHVHSQHPILAQLFRSVLLLTAGAIALAFVTTLYFLSFATARFIKARLGIDRYAHLPTPKTAVPWYKQIIYGDFPVIREAPPNQAHLGWQKETGSSVLVYRHLLHTPRALLCDPRAMMFVLSAANSYQFPKPTQTQRFLESILGKGLLVSEGDEHKHQRKILQPAFAVSAIRDLTPTFFKHAARLVDKLGSIVDATEGPASTPFIDGQSPKSAGLSTKGAPVLDITNWTARTTLDIIGEGGFDTDFNSINDDEREGGDEVARAFKNMLKLEPPSLFSFLITMLSMRPGFGWLGYLPDSRRARARANHAIINRAAQEIIDKKRASIAKEMNGGNGKVSDEKSTLTKADWEDQGQAATGGKDLLMLMMRSNMSSDLKESERLSDAGLIGQCMTLLFAGHETTSTLLGWILYELGNHHDVQEKLRAEIADHLGGRGELDYDELSALPYLDAVVKETLRFSSPVPGTVRCVSKTCVVPLSKAYTTRDGKGTFDSVVLEKGDELYIPIHLLNTSPDIWGPDADVFRPTRWEEIPQSAKDSGFPLQMLTFISGPRGCIGNRFAIAEAKAILVCLLIAFKFDFPKELPIERKQGIVLRSRIADEKDAGMQMPLRVSRV